MAKLKSVTEIIGVITGAAVRHNRALNELRETLEALRELLDMCSKPDIFEDIGPARVEITALMYRMRMKDGTFRKISRKGLRQLLRETYANLEIVRVDLFNPQKGKIDLNKDLSRLNANFHNLEEMAAGIEYR